MEEHKRNVLLTVSKPELVEVMRKRLLLARNMIGHLLAERSAI